MANNRRTTLLIAGGVIVIIAVLALVASSSGWLSGLSLAGAAGRMEPGDMIYMLECGRFKGASFISVQGLGSENEVLREAMADDKGGNVTVQHPGNLTYQGVVLQRRASADGDLYKWRKLVVDGDLDRARDNCTLKVADSKGKLAAVWTMTEVWPSAYDYSSLIDKDGKAGTPMETVTLSADSINRSQ